MNRMNRAEWEELVFTYHKNIANNPALVLERKMWWHTSSTIDSEVMRLTSSGLNRFREAGISFHKYECIMHVLSGSVLLGLNKLQCPFYLTNRKEKQPPEYDFYIVDDQYAMMLLFLDKDLATFAKGLT